MNVEKLNSLAYDIVEENKTLQYVSKFQNVVNTLQNIINQPQQPSHQNNLTKQINALKDALSKSLVNELSPAWYQVLVELQISDVIGNELIKKLTKYYLLIK